MSQELEQYISKHIEPEDEVLKELTRQTHLKVLLPRMLSGHLQGKMLKMLVKMIKPKNILELGTYTGYSAICLANGLPEDGHLHTIEINDELENFIQTYFQKANIQDKITLHIGDALDIIPKFDIKFDLIFIDADKRKYLDYYHALFDLLNPGGFIIADNILWSGKVVEELKANDRYTKGILEFNNFVQNDDRVENVIFPIRDGLMVLRKKLPNEV